MRNAKIRERIRLTMCERQKNAANNGDWLNECANQKERRNEQARTKEPKIEKEGGRGRINDLSTWQRLLASLSVHIDCL